MKTVSKEIPIFFASDDNYVPLLATAIKSLLTNSSKEYTYKIYVLTTNMSQDKRDKIAAMATSNSTIELYFNQPVTVDTNNSYSYEY